MKTKTLEDLLRSKLGAKWKHEVCYKMNWSRPKLNYTLEQPSKFISLADLALLSALTGISANRIMSMIYKQEGV
jgi:hypothetical protein